MPDDMGYADIACHGNPLIQTPHLDRLHAESVRFTDFHVSPTCAPTRAALMTGRHEFKNGVTHTIEERERLTLEAVTLAQMLQRAGYVTGIFGKWHLGDEEPYQPVHRGFNEVFIHGAGGIGQSYPGSCGDVPGNTYLNPIVRHNGRFVRTEGYCTDVFFAQAFEWIDAVRDDPEPFFAYITPNAPHTPLVSPGERYEKPYVGKAIDGKPLSEGDVAYYAMISNIDENIGRLLGGLAERGLDRETLVIFLCDNGGTHTQLFSGGFRGRKGTAYHGGTHAPSFWRWTGTLTARECAALAAHIDVFPTLAALAGIELIPDEQTQIEGRSLLPLLADAAAPWPDRTLVTHVGRWPRGMAQEKRKENYSIRNSRFRLVDDRELYDLQADPGETHNIVGNHPTVVADLRRQYDQWWRDITPLLVNEDVPLASSNAYRVAFEKQLAEGAIETRTITPSKWETQSPAATSDAQGMRRGLKEGEKKYKRRHPAVIAAAAAKNVDEARSRLQHWFEFASDDPENYYALAVVESQANNAAGASHAIDEALRLGLPAERIVAGAHTLLDQTAAAYQKISDAYRYRLVSGPMLGVQTPTSVKVWARTARASTIKVECSASPEFAAVQSSGEAQTSTASDFTGVVELRGLQPSTVYHYRVLVDGREDAARASYQTFKTSPPDGASAHLRVAFGGCAGYTPMNERMWDTIRESKPQTMWLLGDNEYLDAPEDPAVQHYCFYRRQARPEFRRLTASMPVYAIWDDHDFGANDCSGGPEVDFPRWKRPVWNIFRQTWLNPAYGGGEPQPGCWFDYHYGDVHFIFLDGRYYRAGAEHGVNPPTMLGPAQKKWLFHLLTNSTARVTVLVSPVTWALETKGESPDTWHGFQQERQEIFDFLTAKKIPGVVLVSSDRHRSDLLANHRENDYTLHEFNSGLLTNDSAHPVLPSAEFSFNALPSFGLIDIDTASQEPRVTYRILDVNGVERHSFTVELRELQ